MAAACRVGRGVRGSARFGTRPSSAADGVRRRGAVVRAPWRMSRCAVRCRWRRRSPRWMSCPTGGLSPGSGLAHRSVTTTRSACGSRSAGSGSTKPSPFCARCCGTNRHRRPAATTPYRARRWRRPQAEPAECRCGSGAGAQPPVFGASRVSATGGWHPRTTRRPTVSGPRSSRWPSSLTRAARIPIGSRTRSRRCGPGSAKTPATPIACCETVLAPMLRRDPDSLSDRLCVGPAAHCAELLLRYAQAGCDRVYPWPLGDEPRQVELAATTVLPAVKA